MIYCFSGTGNSLRAAKRLAQILGDCITMIDRHTPAPDPTEINGYLGLVFPVYGWGIPLVVTDFLKKFPQNVKHTTLYTYCVLTCGDDIGRTDDLLKEMLYAKGWTVQAVFSLQMRNTYVCLPGFNTDPPALEQEKEHRAIAQLDNIGARIKCKEATTRRDVCPGGTPWIKTYVLRPLFNSLLISDKLFRINLELCSHCGKCAMICPLHNIVMTNALTPQWNGDCTHCLRCYHGCPKHAIEYGYFTKGKGQVRLKYHTD